MIEEFTFTTKYFANEIKEANKQLASLTWARLTWEQRVTLSDKVAVSVATKTTSLSAKYYFAQYNYKRDAVVCKTLSQMQF